MLPPSSSPSTPETARPSHPSQPEVRGEPVDHAIYTWCGQPATPEQIEIIKANMRLEFPPTVAPLLSAARLAELEQNETDEWEDQLRRERDTFLAAIKAWVAADQRSSTLANYDTLKAAKQRLYDLTAGR